MKFLFLLLLLGISSLITVNYANAEEPIPVNVSELGELSDSCCTFFSVSDDGRFVVFESGNYHITQNII